MNFIRSIAQFHAPLVKQEDPYSLVEELVKRSAFNKATEVADKIFNEKLREVAFYEIVKGQVKKGFFNEAIKTIEKIADEKLRGVVFYEIVEELVKRNRLEAAREIIDKMVYKNSKNEAIHLLFKEWMRLGNFDKGIKMIDLIEDKKSKKDLLLSFFMECLKENNVDQALKIIRQISIDFEEELSCDIFNELIVLERISQSIEIFNKLDLRKLKKDPREIICQELVQLVKKNKVDNAVDLANQVVKEKAKGYLLYSIVRMLLIKNDIKKALEIQKIIKDEEFKEETFYAISGKLGFHEDLELGL